MKLIFELMRLFHYTVGITTPAPKQERLVLAVWMVSVLGIILLVIGFAFFILPFIFNSK